MDINNNLILIKKDGIFQDKTKDIKWCQYESGKYKITYNYGKTYPYNYDNVKWFKDPKEIDNKTNLVFYNGEPRNGAMKILDFGEYIKLIFNSGYTETYNKYDITLANTSINTKKSESCLKYLKDLSSLIKIENSNFLEKQYEKMTFINPKSVLSKYLHSKEADQVNVSENFIYPFGFNISQKEATEKAINNQISIIEGPPGTGKTQTILNIISNAIINKKTVAVVSNNNSATSNVIEKLDKYKVGFIAAFLGNTENKEQFVENQTGLYPLMEGWKITEEEEENLKENLNNCQKTLNEMLECKNKLAKLKEELEEFCIEREHYLNVDKSIEIRAYSSFYKQTSDRILALWNNYEYKMKDSESFKLWDKIKYLLKFGIYSFKFYNNSSEDIISLLQNLYYEKKINEDEAEIDAIESKLSRYKFDEKMKEYSDFSMKLFKSSLAKRKGTTLERTKFSKDDLWKNFSDVVREYPVILSTTHSLRNSVGENYLFDYVIVDESSQVDIVSGALALSCAKNVVIVGDEKQLPNVVSEELKEASNEVFDRYNLDEAYKYSEKSLLTSIKTLYQDVPYTLLREHYRCNPKIIGFCNKKFYNGDLIALTEDNIDNPLIVYKTAVGNHARGRINQREIDVIFKEIIPNEELCKENQSVGIISPYRDQANEVGKYIGSLNIEADTVHKFQGREKDSIIISTVSNEMNEFVDDSNLINVAVSRAVNRLILVTSGNKEFIDTNSNISDLIKYISYNNVEAIKESNINSIFDYLYKSYNLKRMELLKQVNKSRYDSENLMALLMDNILKDNKYSNISYEMHYPLKSLINDYSLLNEREIKFVSNIHTHVDFILFNKLDKSPVLVIEIDGYEFHDNNEVQLDRDKIKDCILEKYKLPIIRLKTNGSNEENKVRNKLNSILGCI